jgi:hypothetical protein
MKDCMLDLETLGRTADAVILQIGLCRFNIFTGERDEGFEVNIDLNDSIRQGFALEGSTIEWWLNQDDAARQAVIAKPKFPVKVALQKAAQYMKGCTTLWSHATFDAPILAYHFKKMDVKLPIHYRGHRDIRTLVSLSNFRKYEYEFYRDEGIRHTALADCIRQIKYCSECWKRIMGEA